MSISISVDLQYVDEDKAVFHVIREPVFGISAIALAGLMAAELRKEHGEEGQWFAKLAPMASTEGSTWKDRREVKDLDRDLQERWVSQEYTVRFWNAERDSIFKTQPDGSMLVSMADLTKGVAKPQSVRVRQQGQK